MTAQVWCEVEGCGCPVADTAYVCVPCGQRLTAALSAVTGTADLPGLAADLTVTVTRQDRIDPAEPGASTEPPLPFKPHASEVGWVLRDTLTAWVRILVQEDQYPPADNLAALATCLRRHIEVIRHHPAGADAVDEITAVVAEAHRAIDRPPDRTYAGPCEVCDADLYARPGALQVSCRECGATYDLADRRDWLLEAADNTLAHATLIAQAVTRLGQPVTPERIRQWAHRGRIIARGNDPRGRALYRVGDVLDVLAGDAARKAS